VNFAAFPLCMSLIWPVSPRFFYCAVCGPAFCNHRQTLVDRLNLFRRQFAEHAPHPPFVDGPEVIEAGCKTVIGSRLKRSGMFWTVRGANAILALRCCNLKGRFEDHWADRRAA
jgi:hypothetical protein